MKALGCIVHGKVQGVWFRAWTRDMAREIGVAGWVRNLPDGCVEAHAQGDDDSLALFVERLHKGPPLSRVARVDISHAEPDTSITGFAIRR